MSGDRQTSAAVEAAQRHRRALTPIAMVTVAGCAAGTWWQVERALQGNLPSYLYSFLWPVYGCYVIYVWIRLRRGATTLIGRAPGVDPEPAGEDEEVLQYNRYLAGKRSDVQRRAR